MKIYCINLDRRQDRFARMQDIAAMAQVGLDRVSAVDAKDPGNHPMIAAMKSKGRIGALGAATIACSLSHIRAWRSFLDDPEIPDMAAFLEDDILLSRDFKTTLSDLQSGDFGFDLIKLESTGALRAGAVLGPPSKVNARRTIRQSHQLLLDSAGYILTRQGARALLEKTSMLDTGIDHFLFYPLRRKNFPAVAYGVVIPSVVVQDRSLNSDVSENRFTDKRWQRDLRRAPYEAAQVWHILNGLLFKGARIVSADYED